MAHVATANAQSPAVTQADLANAIRFLAADAVEAASSGHPGMPMGMADVAVVLWSKFLKFDAANPAWPDRDRFVLSAGHGSMLLYAINHLCGNTKLTMDELKQFRQLGSHTPGHPEHDIEAGIETTTGPLGQGFAMAVGLALAERITNARFGDALVNHKTYVIAGDGDMMEGVSSEAASLAGHLKLNRLVVLYDDNNISIDGSTSLSFTENVTARFEAYGWATRKIDGHDFKAIEEALTWAQTSDKPVLIACKTSIGKGAPNKQGTHGVHGSPLGKDEVAAARAHLNWPHAPFTVPSDILAAWRAIGAHGGSARKAWEQRLAASPARAAFDAAQKGKLPEAARTALQTFKEKMLAEKKTAATRVHSGAVLEALLPAWPELVGGSADLTPSNNTFVKGTATVKTGDYNGRYIHWGVREFGMAAMMNGLALHGGLVPYAGTFFVFSDYARPALRLAALMKQRVVHVMTHDSIGLGEDGPTHQPIEHLAALRAIPNMRVLRPCDGIETAEAWELALTHTDGPTVLALTRQNLPALRTDANDAAENKTAKGGYVLREKANAKVTLIASGSEVALAVDVAATLEKENIAARVVSLPSWELFAAQPATYREQVLGTALRVGIEAGSSFGWDRWLINPNASGIGARGIMCGIDSFGASAPYQKLYEHFGLTVGGVVERVKTALAQ